MTEKTKRVKTEREIKRGKKMATVMALSRRVNGITTVLTECKQHFGRAHWDAASQAGNDALVYAKGLFVLLSTNDVPEEKLVFAAKNITTHEKLMFEYIRMAKTNGRM